jgi:hypothetical protein
VANTYKTGSTITLRASFTDISGALTNTESEPIVSVYDKNFQLVGEPLIATQEEVGKYKLFYQIPEGVESTVYFYEFKATMGGIVALNRKKFFAQFSG